MWSKVSIEYGEKTCLELSDGSQIEDVEQIINFLEDKLPPLTKQISNVSRAISKVVKQIRKDQPIQAPNELVENRRAICSKCPFKKTKLFADICTQCGCNIKLKTKLITEYCPLEKW
jgi:hypothetical protein